MVLFEFFASKYYLNLKNIIGFGTLQSDVDICLIVSHEEVFKWKN